MYNGIGLATARGSGTNGHVQRNLSFVRQGKKDNVKYKTEAELAKAEAINNRPPNEEILEHEKKRKIEVKCLEFEEILEDQDYTPEEIAAKVQALREKLLGEIQTEELPKDEFGRYAVRETHQLAAAKHEKNAMLRSAFGISEYFVEGSSFDADRKAKEELAKSSALQKELEAQRALDTEKNKQYKLVRTPSRERETSKEKDRVASDESKGKSSKSIEEKSKRKKNDKSNERRDKKKTKKKADTSESSSSDEDSPPKKNQRKRKQSSSSDDSSDSSSDSEPSKKRSKRGQSKDKKKRTDRSKKSKKHRRHSTSSSSSDSESDSSSSSSSSSSSPSSSSESDSHHKRKHRR